MPALVCEREGCSEPLPPYKGTGRRPKWCSKTCRNWGARQAKRVAEGKASRRGVSAASKPSNRAYTTRDESLDGRASARRGPQYEKFCADGWPQELDSGAMTAGQVAKALGTTGASVSRWMAAYREDLIAAAKVHERTREGTSLEAKQSLEDFAAFRARYFRVPDEKGHVLRGVPYQTPDFQGRWVSAVNDAIDNGGKLQILAPPRHGKPLSVDTPVTMGDGSIRKLADIQVGDEVMTHRLRPRRVSKVHEQGPLPTMRIRTRLNSVRAAYDHPFLVWNPNEEREWKKAGCLLLRDWLVRDAGGELLPIPVESLERAGSDECRCLEVEDDHTFLADGLVVHNTELLNHFCLWLICRNPNIRIMMVGGAEDIASQSVQQVKDELENNEALINDFAGPAGQFKPGYRTGKSWSADRFTIEGRTVSGLKSPTMAAVGRGGRLLSRDADLIIVDDPEDHDSTVQPHAREKTKNWFRTQLLSRKEPHTAIFVIGSRQHAEDLYSALLDDPTFHSIVETAHDDAVCTAVDGADDDAHQDCVLFPKLRPYSWLMQQQSSMGRALYEMVYLNRPRAEGLAVFSKKDIEACKSRRRIGHVPEGVRLVAGLDPASTGYQAAVLWGYNPDTRVRYLIDLQNEEGGGVAQARNIIERWYKQYQCQTWVVEENNFQKAIRLDETLRAFCLRENIELLPHETHNNKWDPQMGVTSMAPLFEPDPMDEKRHVDLPWGDAESERQVLPLIRQWLNFSDAVNNKRKGYKSDLVMAAWFPEKVIRRWRQEFFAEMSVDYTRGGGVQWQTEMTTAPWG